MLEFLNWGVETIRAVWNDEKAKAAVIATLITITVQGYRNWSDKRRDRLGLMVAIWHETVRLCDYVGAVGSYCNALPKGSALSAEAAARYMPPSPVVFTELSPRLLLLEPQAVSHLVAFHVNLRRARDISLSLPSAKEEVGADDPRELPQEVRSTERLREAWQRAAFHGAQFIRLIQTEVVGKRYWWPMRSKAVATERAKLVSWANQIADQLDAVVGGKVPALANGEPLIASPTGPQKHPEYYEGGATQRVSSDRPTGIVSAKPLPDIMPNLSGQDEQLCRTLRLAIKKLAIDPGELANSIGEKPSLITEWLMGTSMPAPQHSARVAQIYKERKRVFDEADCRIVAVLEAGALRNEGARS